MISVYILARCSGQIDAAPLLHKKKTDIQDYIETMVQSHFVGVFFCVGLVSGILMTLIMSPLGQVRVPLDTRARVPDGTWVSTSRNLSDSPPKARDIIRVVDQAPMSHEEVDMIPGPDKPVVFSDGHMHKGL